jgi:hypothetical protein
VKTKKAIATPERTEGSFPDCRAAPIPHRQLLLGFLDYYRSVIIRKFEGAPESELRASRLPSRTERTGCDDSSAPNWR